MSDVSRLELAKKGKGPSSTSVQYNSRGVLLEKNVGISWRFQAAVLVTLVLAKNLK